MPSEHSQFYALYWWVALTLERRHLLISRSVYALVDSPCLIPNSLYTFGLGTFYSPCLQTSDQLIWFRYIFTALFRSADPSRELSCIARPRFGACSNNYFLSCFTLFPVSRWRILDSP